MRILITAILTLFLSTTVFAEDAPANAFTMTTDAFLDTGPIPVLYTCDGKDVSPMLEWSNVPAKAKAFALIMKDPKTESGEFFHWVVYNIPASVKTLPQNSSKLPNGAKAAKNSFSKDTYNGPCPPKGSAHNYVLTLYALDAPLNVPAGAKGADVEKALGKHVVGKAELSTVYSRWLK